MYPDYFIILCILFRNVCTYFLNEPKYSEPVNKVERAKKKVTNRIFPDKSRMKTTKWVWTTNKKARSQHAKKYGKQ